MLFAYFDGADLEHAGLDWFCLLMTAQDFHFAQLRALQLAGEGPDKCSGLQSQLCFLPTLSFVLHSHSCQHVTLVCLSVFAFSLFMIVWYLSDSILLLSDADSPLAIFPVNTAELWSWAAAYHSCTELHSCSSALGEEAWGKEMLILHFQAHKYFLKIRSSLVWC